MRVAGLGALLIFFIRRAIGASSHPQPSPGERGEKTLTPSPLPERERGATLTPSPLPERERGEDPHPLSQRERGV